MAIRDIIRMGHPTLRTPAKPYPIEDIGSPQFNQLVEDLTDTLADSGGIGLAAPQIDEPVQVVIVNIPGGENRYGELEAVPWSVYVNPVLTVLDDSRAAIGRAACRYLVCAASWFGPKKSPLIFMMETVRQDR
jgi:peptide deformylase